MSFAYATGTPTHDGTLGLWFARRFAHLPEHAVKPPACPYCSGSAVLCGKDKDGERRLRRRSCRKTFRINGRKRQPAQPKIRRNRTEVMRQIWQRMTFEERTARAKRAAARRLAVQSPESRSRGSKAAQASIDPELRRQRAQKAALARWAGHQIEHPCPRCQGPTQPYENRKRICKSTACRRAQRAERKQRKENQCPSR